MPGNIKKLSCRVFEERLMVNHYVRHHPLPIPLAAFPDLRFTVEDETSEGELVVTYWTATGTQEGGHCADSLLVEKDFQ